MSPLILNSISKNYPNIQALRGVSFAVEPGDVFGYLGPNGAGKTTTLRIILGLARPTDGEVNLFGMPSSKPAARERCGYLPGELHLYGGMTARALLDYFAAFRQHRPPVLRPNLLEALDVSPALLGQKVKSLSHGARKKIGLIIAMQHDPDLLLLDEPTTALDPLVQKSLRELILDAARRGRAVFFSTHVLSEAEALCSRVAILRAGRIVTLATIEDLRSTMLRRLDVRFHQPPPADLAGAPGVVRAEISGRSARLWVRGDINAVVRSIARAEIEHLVFPEPELEDIFIAYYKENG